MTRLLLLVPILVLAGCATTREAQTKHVEAEEALYSVSPIVADTPVGQVTLQPATVAVKRKKTAETQENSRVEAQPSIPPGIAAPASGLLGLVPGVGGLLAAGLALWSRQRAIGTVKAVTEAVEDFKGQADHTQVEKLHGCLSRKMDKSHKDLIRKVKA